MNDIRAITVEAAARTGERTFGALLLLTSP
jgi:hypothetical protein